jgi:dipeptide transport system permease protein
MATETTIPIPAGPDRMQALREFWFYFSVNRGAVLGLIVFVLLIIVAIFAPILAPFPPDKQFREFIRMAPYFAGGTQPQFILGTDEVGRDILSRLIHGARYSLFIGFFVVTVAMLTGVTLGLLAGYFRGWVDAVIMRVMDIILAFPSLLLALVLVAILGPGLFNAMLAIALVLQPHFARLTRAAVLAEKNREYVTAARLSGAGNLRLMFKTILPNCLGPLIVQATLSFSNAILEAAALGLPRHGRPATDAGMGHHAGARA